MGNSNTKTLVKGTTVIDFVTLREDLMELNPLCERYSDMVILKIFENTRKGYSIDYKVIAAVIMEFQRFGMLKDFCGVDGVNGVNKVDG